MATAAPRKPARMNGLPRLDKGSPRGPQSKEADRLLAFLRTELSELRNRLGWTAADIMRKMPKYHSKSAVESAFKEGGFHVLVELARTMGMRVIVDLK